MVAHVTLDSSLGTVTVGNITVTGGVKDASVFVADNFESLTTWLSLTGSKVTVGNIDYSGYGGGGFATNIIDAHAYSGAAVIKGSTGGSSIYDNKGVNAITFSDTTKADFAYLQNSQTGVKDSGTAVTATDGALDTITGWASGDKLTLVDKTAAVTTITGDGVVVQNTPTQDFATFLTHAESQIDGAGHSAYVAIIGGNTYVALATGLGTLVSPIKVGEIVEIMGSHTFTLTADGGGYDLGFLS